MAFVLFVSSTSQAPDQAYIDYGKFEEMTQRGVIYVTKMKQNLTYEVTKSTYYMNAEVLMQWKEEFVTFRKEVKTKNEETGGLTRFKATLMHLNYQ